MKIIQEPNQADLGASQTAIEQGYTNTEPTKRGGMVAPRTDSDGSTYEGSPYEQGGVLGRPHGWER